MTARALVLSTRPAAASGPTVAFRSLASTGYAGRTNTTLAAPSGLADGDILVAALLVASNSTPAAPTPPSGFAELGTPTTVVGGSLTVHFRVYWKRAAAESGSYTWTHANYSTQGVLLAYSGCLASGTPLGAASNNTGSGPGATTSTGLGIATTAANSFLLWLSHDYEGTGALSPPAGMTERFDSLVYCADELIASAGATGNRTQINGNNATPAEQWAVRMVELLNA